MGWGSLIGLAVGLIAALLGLQFWFWRRNNDPFNRNAAAEICAYLTDETEDTIDPLVIAEIFTRNARYQAQARHVATMFPILLENAGYPKGFANQALMHVALAVQLVPK